MEIDHLDRAPCRTQPLWLALLLTLTFTHGLLYSLVIPPWQAPDETGHFEMAWLTAHLGRAPTVGDMSPAFERELLRSLYQWRYGEFIGRPLPEEMPARLDDLPPMIHAQRSRPIQANRFSLAYVWQAMFLVPVRSRDLTFQLRIARISSILLNLGIVWLALRTCSDLLPSSRRYLAWPMAAVVALQPQHTFINSAVGDGPLAELMACLVLRCWAHLFRHGVTAWTIIGIVLGTGAGLWTKATTGFLLPLDLGLTLWWMLARPDRTRTWRQAMYLAAGIVALGVVAWASIYVLSAVSLSRLGTMWNSVFSGSLLWVDQRGISFAEALLLTHDSFWANFGWMNVPVSGRWYGALLLLSGAAAWGWIFGARDGDRLPPWAAAITGGSLLIACLIYAWGELLAQPRYYSFQGRYLFPVMIPFAFLLVGGWWYIAPLQRRRVWTWSVVILIALFDVWCLVGYLLPRYWG